MELNERTRWYLRAQNVIFFVLVLGILGVIAWLGERHSVEFDWTANQRNSLTAESEELLRRIKGPVEIVAYASSNPMLRERIELLIGRYQRTKQDIELQFVNPDLSPEQARAEGVRFDGTLVIRYQGRREQLTLPGESELSNALARLARGGEEYTVFVTGHGERQHDGDANFDLATLGAELRNQGFRLQAMNLAASEIPGNTGLLVIASPQTEWLPVEIDRLRGYLEAGGNLVWLTDPDGVAKLPELQELLGLEVRPGVVVDPATQLFGVADPTIALVTNYPMQGPLADFRLLTLFPRAAGLAMREGSEWNATPLLRTLAESWRETGTLAGTVSLDGDDEAGPITIGYALERQVGEGDEARNQRVVVVGDGDFASNAFVANQGNLDLALNLFNWAGAQDAMLNIRIKEAPDVQLALSNLAQVVIAAFFLLALPLMLLSGGVVVFLRRRRR